MTGPTDDVDRTAVGRGRQWRRWLSLAAVMVCSAAFVVVLSGSIPALLGPLGWAVVAAYLIACLVADRQGRRPDERRRSADARRIEHALREHLDPGPELRERADRQAQHLSRAGWSAPVFPLLLLTLLDDAPWDRPALAVPAVVVLAGGLGVLMLFVLRSARDARRWLADPPGPPRQLPPPLRWQRSIRWVAVLGAIALFLGLVVGLVAELT